MAHDRAAERKVAWRYVLPVLATAAMACGEQRERATIEGRVASRRAPWLEDALPDESLREVQGGRLITVGLRSALAGGTPDVAVLDVDRGLVGYLQAPDDDSRVGWVGLGEGDAVLAATEEGTLYGADTIEAAMAGEFRVRGAVRGAVRWDAAHDLVAAVADNAVHVSVDGGRTFSVGRPTAEPLDRVLVRPPGTVVAVVRGPSTASRIWSTWISLDAGRTWQRSSYAHPLLTRMGSWITDAVARCPAVLAADGSWRIIAARELAERRVRLAAWPAGWTGAEPWYRATLRPLTLDEPLPGVDEGPLNQHPCRRPRPATAPPPPPPPPGDESPYPGAVFDSPIQLEDEPPIESATRFELADDGTCSSVTEQSCLEEVNGACRSIADQTCTGALVRLPHLVIKDQRDGTAAVERIPDRCRPVQLLSARGLGVLLCRGGGEIELQVTDRKAAWQREGAFPDWAADFENIDVAADGTVVLTTMCEAPGSCHAVVRDPVAVGAADAWWTAAHAGAVGYRPLPDGKALAIDARDAGDGHVDVAIWRLARGHRPELVTRTTVVAPLMTVSVRDGQLRINGTAVR